MKKLLGIVVLGLLLSSNAYAASKFTYLSCPSIIYQNENKGKYKDSELYKIGSYTGHYFIKFKDTKKKFTTVTLYSQGNQIPPVDSDIWMSLPLPPKKLLKEKFLYTTDSYVFGVDYEGVDIFWMLQRIENQFNLLQINKLVKQDINFTTTSNKDFDNDGFCEEVDKKEFNELIKKGIKKNTDTKSNDDLLKSLNELYKSGALTKEEFEKAKKRILNK